MPSETIIKTNAALDAYRNCNQDDWSRMERHLFGIANLLASKCRFQEHDMGVLRRQMSALQKRRKDD